MLQSISCNRRPPRVTCQNGLLAAVTRILFILTTKFYKYLSKNIIYCLDDTKTETQNRYLLTTQIFSCCMRIFAWNLSYCYCFIYFYIFYAIKLCIGSRYPPIQYFIVNYCIYYRCFNIGLSFVILIIIMSTIVL